MFAVQILKFLWPFIKEMIIGKNSFRYALRKNRVKVFFFALVILSFFLNLVLVPRLISISASHVELSRHTTQLQSDLESVEKDRQLFTDNNALIAKLKEENTTLGEKVKKLEEQSCSNKTPTPKKKSTPSNPVPTLPKQDSFDMDKVNRRFRYLQNLEKGGSNETTSIVY